MKNLVILLSLGLAGAAYSQVGRYYATQGSNGPGQTVIYQAGAEVGRYNWAADAQMPIVVGDFGSGARIRQAAGQPISGSPQQGDEYLLNGTATGFTNFWDSGNPADSTAYDAGFDGKYIYMVHWLGPTDGQVWRYDNNYANGQFLFQANGSAAGGDLGITYDSRTNTIWTGTFFTGQVTQWSMGGAMLSSFSIIGGSASALAYDSQSDTFWLSNGVFGVGTLLNYDRNGNLLGNFTTGEYLLGGEFYAVPEPASLLALGLGALALRRRRK